MYDPATTAVGVSTVRALIDRMAEGRPEAMRLDEPNSAMESLETSLKIAVAASFTAEPVLETLALWMRELGLNAAIEFAPYNQVFQELLNPGSLLSQNHGGMNVILLRPEDWLRFNPGAKNPDKARVLLERNACDFIDALHAAISRAGIPHLVALCPASPPILIDASRRSLLESIEQRIVADLEQVGGVTVIGPDDYAAYPVDVAYDPQRDALGHIPYTPLCFAAIGTLLARRIHALKSPPYKVIVLDCDNTIWKGVVGEDGAMGVTMPPSCQTLQQFVVEQVAKGFLVCLCSKNEERDVLEVLERRTEMPLKREHVVAWRINWAPKSENIRSLAQELNVGLDAFLFVDDNPVECAEVRANCPEVLTLQLPPPDDVGRFFSHLWAFDRLRVTSEDRQRTSMYRENAERSRVQRQAQNFQEFLSELELRVDITAPTPVQLDRVAQLTQRTNQFNFTTIRRTESEIRQLAEMELECRIVEVCDRFGDYGLVGVLIYGISAGSLETDTFLLSCRVLGRGVEHRMLNYLGDNARKRGLDSVVATVIPTGKNLPARQFLDSVAVAFKKDFEGKPVYRIPAEFAATTAPSSDGVKAEVAKDPGSSSSSLTAGFPSRIVPPYERIASILHSPDQVLLQLDAQGRKRRERPSLGQPPSPPSTEIERRLSELWADLLKLERVGIHDNFFDLGGDSLLVTRVVSWVRQAFSVELSLRSLFDAPTIAGLAGQIQNLQSTSQSQTPPIQPVSRDGRLPLSFAQQRLWFLDQYETDRAVYNIPYALRLLGPLEVDRLRESLVRVVHRHEALRTSIAMVEGEPFQVIASTVVVDLPVVDLSGLPEEERDQQAWTSAVAEARRPFDLGCGPLVRAQLIRLSAQEHLLLLSLHHIIADGWSMGLLFEELKEYYRSLSVGAEARVAELPLHYADYAVWQREWLQGEELDRQAGYWKERLSGAPALLELPTDHPRPALQSYCGACELMQLSPTLSEGLKALSRREGVTLFMTLVAGFKVLLSRYSGQEDVVVGSRIAGRTRREFEHLIGFFVNTLVLRTDLSGDPTVRELLGRVREMAMGAYAHQDLPFEKLVEELRPPRSLSYSPLFQVLLVLQNAPRADMEIAGLEVRSEAVHSGTSKFDMTLSVEETSAGLRGTLEYNTDLFDAVTIRRMLGHYQRLLEGMVADPGQPISRLPLLTEDERHQLLVEWNNTACDYPADRCVHQLFEEQVERTPDAVALVFEDQELTYGELNARSNQLAHYLQSQGVGPETLVAICMERSPEMVVGLLGILKAGGAYVPLDPEYPAERLAFMLQDAQAPLLLTQRHLCSRVSAQPAQIICLDHSANELVGYGDDKPLDRATADNLAYVIYTSGSTGTPKGVLISHGGLVNLVQSQIHEVGVSEDDRVLQFASLSFDASILEIGMALLSGATLVLTSRATLLSTAELTELLVKESVTVAAFTPAMLDVLPAVMPALKKILCGGSACSQKLVSKWFDGRAFFNEYGPTECTVCATMTQCDPTDGVPPIGRPISNMRLYVLDCGWQPVPVGVPGELYIGGVGLARGYWNRPNLTAEKFLPDPLGIDPGGRLYKTGDLVRWRADGNLEFLGRLDDQVKIRGFRIELGEIEASLARHPGLQRSVVVAREDEPGDKRLVAYVVPADLASPPSTADLRSFLGQELPEYMIPSAFAFLDRLPLSPNGKVDRKALPEPGEAWAETSNFIAPRTPIEEILVGIWAEVLGSERVGVADNFFELGGHSLRAMRVIARVHDVLGVEVAMRTFFEAPTVQGMAAVIDQKLLEPAEFR